MSEVFSTSNRDGRQFTTGDKFNDWTLVRPTPNNPVSRWICRCVCGKEKIVRLLSLTTDASKNCGCQNRVHEELKVGDLVGGLRVVSPTEPGFKGAKRWICECPDCKHQSNMLQNDLFNRRRDGAKCKSCLSGALRNQFRKEYSSWRGMISRCTDPDDAFYSDYGGRGITVCSRWLGSFETFLDDMGPRPEDKKSIDRYPDNNGNYEPGNCRWADDFEQSRGRRSNVWLEYNGERMVLTDWALRTGIGFNTLSSRLRRGWSVDKVLTTPVNGDNDEKDYTETDVV